MEERKILSPVQIAAGSLWGGPIAPIYFLRKNYLSLGKAKSAQKTLTYGTLFIIILLSIAFFLPESFPNSTIPILYSIFAWQLAGVTQMNKEQIKQSDKYTFESNFKIFIAGSLALIIFFIILATVILFLAIFGFISLD